MKYRQAKKILKKYAKTAANCFGRKFKTGHCSYNKACTVYDRHFKRMKKKVTSNTVMTFIFPCV